MAGYVRLLDDKEFRWYVKKNGFKLIDIPELSLRDALVVTVKEGKGKLLTLHNKSKSHEPVLS